MPPPPPPTPIPPAQGVHPDDQRAWRPYWQWGTPYTSPGVQIPSDSTPKDDELPDDTALCICPSCGTRFWHTDVSNLLDEGSTSLDVDPEDPRGTAPSVRPYADRRTRKAKIFSIMSLMSNCGLTLGEVLVDIFTPGFFGVKAAGSLNGARSYGRMVGAFLRGRSNARVSTVLGLWLRHPFGLPKENHVERGLLFSLSVPWTDIRHARVSLTAWAAQACSKALERETRHVIEPEHGLHAMIHTPRRSNANASPPSRNLVRWSDIGSKTLSDAREVFETTTPLLWGLLRQVAEKQRAPNMQDRAEQRPWPYVVTAAIGQLLFCRRRTVNLLALHRSLTLFATRASTIVYRIESRFGATTTYNTVLDSLRTAGNERIESARAIARSTTRWFKFVFDNVQRYQRQWEMRAGRENKMLKGTAGTLFEMVGFHPKAHDLSEKVRLIAEGHRFRVTANDLRRLIDMRHKHRINALHWLQVLVDYVPELAGYHQAVADLFTAAAKEPTRPPGRTNIISLRTNAHDPQYTTGISRALDDFLETQLGQSKDDGNRRVVVVGGDGATFEGLLRVKRERQNHDDPYDRYDHVQPELELFHTRWTELSGIFAAHCGPLNSKDPSTLRASITLIGRSVPPDLSKVEFQSSLHTLMLIGEARMLDCWRVKLETFDLLEYFSAKVAQGALPSLDDLLAIANQLDYIYSSSRAHYTATDYRARQPEDYRAPEDEEWVRTLTDEEIGEAEGFGGDRVLANSICFLIDFLDIREWTHATAAGEVGRLYEIFKIVLFKFAGSGHKPRYLGYVLDTILSLEYESTPALKLARLINWLVNPTGLPGHNVEGDMVQEHHIKPLTAHSRCANAAYDGDFERNILSPNLDSLVALSRRMEEAVGLRSRSHKHTSMHTNPELRRLLSFYSRKQLHRFRVGRSYGHTAPSRFAKGMEEMPGKLKKYLDACRADGDVFGRMWNSFAGDDNNTDEIQDEADPDEDPGTTIMDDGRILALPGDGADDVQGDEDDTMEDEGGMDAEDGSDEDEEAQAPDDLDELWMGSGGEGDDDE